MADLNTKCLKYQQELLKKKLNDLLFEKDKKNNMNNLLIDKSIHITINACNRMYFTFSEPPLMNNYQCQ